jgi:hypothetical protein
VAAFSTPDPKADARGQKPAERLRLLRPLGARSFPAWAALDESAEGGARLVVADRAQRREFDDGDIADWIRDARRLEALDHPNVARVRGVLIRSQEILVVTEFVDGVRWKELAASAPAPPLETALRIFVDVLSGLNALHNLRDAKRQPVKLVHGALTPESIVIGIDGVAKLVGAARPRAAAARAGEGNAYLAPEVLLEDDSADARADTYSVGVMLWEALSGRPFLPDLQPSAIVTQLLSGRSPAVTMPASAPWAAQLEHVVKRALSADPAKRFASASAMAAELRRIAGPRLPSATVVGSAVRAAFGETARARRQELERGVVRPPPLHTPAVEPGSEELSIDVFEPVEEASQTAPTVPPPGMPDAASAAADEPAEARPVAMPLEAPVPAFASLPTFAPEPSAPLTLPPETTTSVPLVLPAAVLATPLTVTTPLAGAARPRRAIAALGLGLAGFAAIALAATTWWIAARGSGTAGPATRAGVEVKVEASAPHRAAVLPPQSAAVLAPVPPPAESIAMPEEPAALAQPAAPVNAPPVVPAAPAPRFTPQPVPARPRPAPVRRGYDPQGI